MCVTINYIKVKMESISLVLKKSELQVIIYCAILNSSIYLLRISVGRQRDISRFRSGLLPRLSCEPDLGVQASWITNRVSSS